MSEIDDLLGRIDRMLTPIHQLPGTNSHICHVCFYPTRGRCLYCGRTVCDLCGVYVPDGKHCYECYGAEVIDNSLK